MSNDNDLPRLYLQIGRIGKCDAKGKAIGFATYKAMRGEVDKPARSVIAVAVHLLIQECDWSSREAAKEDLDFLKKYINGLSVPDEQPDGMGCAP